MADEARVIDINAVDWARFSAKYRDVTSFKASDIFMATGRRVKRRNLTRREIWPHIHAVISLHPCGMAELRSIRAGIIGLMNIDNTALITERIDAELRYDLFHENLIMMRATVVIIPKD